MRTGYAGVVVLSLVAALSAAIVLVVRGYLHESADVARLQTLRATLRQVPMPAHDNDPAGESFPVSPDMHRSGIDAVYVARSSGRVVGVYAIATVEGYADDIVLLVGIDADHVTGVSVIEQRETEGYGARVAGEERGWLETFDGRRLAAAGEASWRLRQDGGGVDAISGATITSRNLLQGVREVLDAVSRSGVMRAGRDN
jgi:electron transport complex protein RnfG